MGRKRIQFSSTLKTELMDNLRNLSDTSGIPISKLLDQSIELLLDHYNREASPYRNPINTRSNIIDKEESAKIDNKEPDIELNDIFNIDLNQVQDALNTIKSFQIKFNPDLIEKAKNMSLNDFKGEFKKSFDKYVTNQIKDSKIYDDIPPVKILQSRDDVLSDRFDDIIDNLELPNSTSAQIDTSKSNK